MRVLDYAGFRAELKSGVSGGYLFCGEESYLLRHSLAALRRSLFGESGSDAFNHVRIDASYDRACDIPGAICQLPVFADRRLVELSGLDLSHMKAEATDELCGALALLPDNPQTVLVLCATPYELDVSGMKQRNPKPSKQLTRLGEYLTPVIFDRETPSAIAKWAAAHFAHGGAEADRDAIQTLIARTGCDMFALSGEIDKLCAYGRATGKPITSADVVAMCAVNAEIGAFDFSNAILDGNYDRAFALLTELKKRRAEPVAVLADVTRCCSRIETVSAFAEDGVPPAEIAKKLKLHEYAVRLHLKAAGRAGRERITRALALCSEADRKMKFTSIDGYVIIYRLLASLAAL